MTVSINITGYGVARDPRVPEFIVFIMVVQQGGSNSWTIYRRFDSFRSLSDQLHMLIGDIPSCPPKRHLDVRVIDTMDNARVDLAAWMFQLLQIPAVMQSRPFQEFLMTEANLAPPGLQYREFPVRAGSLGDMDMDDMFAGPNDDNGFMGGPEHYEDDRDEEVFQNEIRSINPNPKDKVDLDDFALLKVIGKGSFGKVLQVRKRDSGAIYAMKVLRKENIIKRNQVEHTRTERHVLGYVRHPYVVGLNYAFQTADKLYFVLDYCAGGELFFHLGKLGKFPEARACFYAAEITLALDYIHKLDIIYRDLKPENVLLDENGHIKLTDFGLSKEGVQDNFSGAHSFCGTPEYLAPEILNRSGHGRAVDWWSLGSLLYEMLTGLPPFYCRDRDRLFDKIRRAELAYPKYLSENAKSLLKGLLERDPTKRLGTGPDDAEDIKRHPFFAGIEWDKLYAGHIPPPWTPAVMGSLDTSQFDREFTSMPIISPDSRGASIMAQRESDHLFQGFTFTEDSVLTGNRPPRRSEFAMNG